MLLECGDAVTSSMPCYIVITTPQKFASANMSQRRSLQMQCALPPDKLFIAAYAKGFYVNERTRLWVGEWVGGWGGV